MNPLSSAIFAAALIFGGSASAATISITSFSAGALSSATSGLSNVVAEGFEALGGEGEITPGTSLATSVGDFSTLGGTGSGGTVKGLPGNTGTNLAIRDGNVFGREATDGSYFLDSNDTHGIRWDVASSLGAFNSLVFTLMDASEFSFLRIIADGVTKEQRIGSALGNGNISLVEIALDSKVSSLVVELQNFTSFGGSVSARNDGFSIDSVSVGIAPVPVPASLPLLAMGAGAFAFIRRKKRSA